jgi:hypothetical protein
MNSKDMNSSWNINLKREKKKEKEKEKEKKIRKQHLGWFTPLRPISSSLRGPNSLYQRR